MRIIVNIEAGENGECGQCRFRYGWRWSCNLYNVDLDGEVKDKESDENWLRCPACLAAEQEYKRLIEISEQYHELIFSVSEKYPGETRHETALRYVKAAEQKTTGAGQAQEEERHG